MALSVSYVSAAKLVSMARGNPRVAIIDVRYARGRRLCCSALRRADFGNRSLNFGFCPRRVMLGNGSGTEGTMRGATRRTSRGRTTSPAAASRRGCRSWRGPPAARTPSSSTALSARYQIRRLRFSHFYPKVRTLPLPCSLYRRESDSLDNAAQGTLG